ncbi:MAG: winged helix-turn-helix domain-containing protein [Propionicimonas sp.]
MGITVLGPLTVDGVALSGRRDRVVLAVLATSPGMPFPVDQLTDALWDDQPTASPSKILQGCIVRLRKLLGPDAITTDPRGYSSLETRSTRSTSSAPSCGPVSC